MSTRRRYELSDLEWSIIQPLLPNKPRRDPRVDDRRVLNGIYWRLRTGSDWVDIPERYGPAKPTPSTVSVRSRHHVSARFTPLWCYHRLETVVCVVGGRRLAACKDCLSAKVRLTVLSGYRDSQTALVFDRSIGWRADRTCICAARSRSITFGRNKRRLHCRCANWSKGALTDRSVDRERGSRRFASTDALAPRRLPRCDTGDDPDESSVR